MLHKPAMRSMYAVDPETPILRHACKSERGHPGRAGPRVEERAREGRGEWGRGEREKIER